MTRDPFDFSEMMKMFDPKNMSKMFDPDQFKANMAGFNLPNFDFESVVESNKKNLEAIQEANKSSAEAFRDMYAMQMAIFDELTKAAKNSAESLNRGPDKNTAVEQEEICRTAVEKAFSLMSESAESMRKANQEAFGVIEDRVKAAIAEISQSAPAAAATASASEEKSEQSSDQAAPATSASPDDLTRIKGIGPVLQEKLNALGISTLRQIADLTPADIERINSSLDFPGRIEREQWVEQARAILAETN